MEVKLFDSKMLIKALFIIFIVRDTSMSDNLQMESWEITSRMSLNTM